MPTVLVRLVNQGTTNLGIVLAGYLLGKEGNVGLPIRVGESTFYPTTPPLAVQVKSGIDRRPPLLALYTTSRYGYCASISPLNGYLIVASDRIGRGPHQSLYEVGIVMRGCLSNNFRVVVYAIGM